MAGHALAEIRVPNLFISYCHAHIRAQLLLAWGVPLDREGSFLCEIYCYWQGFLDPTQSNLSGCNVLQLCLFTSMHTRQKLLSRNSLIVVGKSLVVVWACYILHHLTTSAQMKSWFSCPCLNVLSSRFERLNLGTIMNFSFNDPFTYMGTSNLLAKRKGVGYLSPNELI